MPKAKPAATADHSDDLRYIALSDLTLSPLNSRQTVPEAEILAMAESLAVAGLLQNLIGVETSYGTVEIVGGGKRLRALQLLAGEGWNRIPGMQRIDPVPVKVTADDHRAVAWSGTENTARTELHPADEVRAYAALRDRGSSVSMIARSFARSELHVERRLKLASLPTPVIDALRAGEITIDMARALTVAPSDEKALEVLASVRGRDVQAWVIRRDLTPGTVHSNDRRARFVGLEAYEARGGKVIRDLFEGHSYLSDDDLLDRMVLERGEVQAEIIAAEGGWSWALFHPGFMHDAPVKGLERLWPKPGSLPDADQEEYDRLTELAEGHALDEAGEAELARLQARLDGDYSDEDRATGGVIVALGGQGKLEVALGWRRPSDRPAQQEVDDTTTVTRIAPATPAEPAGMPQNLLDDLAAIYLASLQSALLADPELLLDLLAWQLTADIWTFQQPLALRADPPCIQPERPEGTALPARLQPKRGTSTDATPEAFDAFREKGRAHRDTALTEGLARLFATPRGALAEAIATHLQPDTRALWSPTATGFLGRCGNAYLLSLWCALVPPTADDPTHSAFASLKKAEKARQLEALFSDLSVREALGLDREHNNYIDAWLPEQLRWPARATEDAQ